MEGVRISIIIDVEKYSFYFSKDAFQLWFNEYFEVYAGHLQTQIT